MRLVLKRHRLFTGGMPGKPITASQLGERPRTLGIYAMPGRRAALTAVAALLGHATLTGRIEASHEAPEDA